MFQEEEYLGSVRQVYPQFVKAHISIKNHQPLLGDFVLIQGSQKGFLGKILDVVLEGVLEIESTVSMRIETLLSFEYEDLKAVSRGLDCHPAVGDLVYMSTEAFVQNYLGHFGLKYGEAKSSMQLGCLKNNARTPIQLSQQSFFSRHCAIVGTTGSGKSWTIAKLVEEMNKNNTKIILIDPTGEFKSIADDKFLSITLAQDAYFHYRHLTIEDLFYLIKPTGKTQMPKLLEAIRSLKALELDEFNYLREYKLNGLIRKANKKKAGYEKFYFEQMDKIEDGHLKFDIKFLSAQITQECIYDTDKNDPEKYGNRDEEAVSQCVNLISRTSNLLHTEIFQKVFGFNETIGTKKDLTFIINKFIASDEKNVLHINFEKIGFEFQAREIIANAIGAYLLKKARASSFMTKPMVVFLDEAHQFLNKTVVDDYFQGSSLTAFEMIAKECRKYGLFICLSTQMPRDIPAGTLSQMGTFLVHRLINANDKAAIAEACSSAGEDMLKFLPVLGEGEAILTGVDFPMDVTLQVDEPRFKPASNTPTFDRTSDRS